MPDLRKFRLLALPALLAAAAFAREGDILQLTHPELEQMPIDTGEAEKRIEDIQYRVRHGELPKVRFDFDSARLRPESNPTLNAIAEVMLRFPQKKLLITAHTCRIGSEAYNYKLSLLRAKAVRDYLIRQGVRPPSIRYRGKGFSEPVADNGSPEGRRLNRRVEFHVLTRDWSAVY